VQSRSDLPYRRGLPRLCVRGDGASPVSTSGKTQGFQRKKRIFGFPGIIAPATSTTTITTASSILPSQPCLHHQNASAQLTSFCGEGKVTKVVGAKHWSCTGRDSRNQTQPRTSTSASEKTSAVKASRVTVLRQASAGRPALRQVCWRKVSRSPPYSTGTWGSSKPRRTPSEMSRPWRPTSTASGGIENRRESTLRETSS